MVFLCVSCTMLSYIHTVYISILYGISMSLVWYYYNLYISFMVLLCLLWGTSIIYNVFDLISEHTLISGHPHFVLVEIIARARRDQCVLAVLLCCIMQSIFYAN